MSPQTSSQRCYNKETQEQGLVPCAKGSNETYIVDLVQQSIKCGIMGTMHIVNKLVQHCAQDEVIGQE